jgi:hypothetical protein
MLPNVDSALRVFLDLSYDSPHFCARRVRPTTSYCGVTPNSCPIKLLPREGMTPRVRSHIYCTKVLVDTPLGKCLPPM